MARCHHSQSQSAVLAASTRGSGAQTFQCFLHMTSFSFTAKFLDIKDVLNPKCFPDKQVVEWPHYQSDQLFTDHRRCSHTARCYTAESSRILFLCDVCQLQLPLTFISVSRLGGLPQCKPGSLAHKGSGDGEWQSPTPASQMVTRPRCRLYTRSPPQTETYEWNRHTDGFIQRVHSWEDSFNKMMFLWFHTLTVSDILGLGQLWSVPYNHDQYPVCVGTSNLPFSASLR